MSKSNLRPSFLLSDDVPLRYDEINTLYTIFKHFYDNFNSQLVIKYSYIQQRGRLAQFV